MLKVVSIVLAETESTSWPEWLEQLTAHPFWVIGSLTLAILVPVFVFGDALSGTLSLFGIESPFRRRRSTPSESDRQKTRRKLLQIIEGEIELRLETSLHERIKLDLYLEDQRQQVGKPQTEVVPPDRLEASAAAPSLIDRFFQTFRKRTASPIPLASTQRTVEVFDRTDTQGKLLILGEPGSGKTTELRHLAKDLVDRAAKDENLPIPLILELSTWNEGQSIERWISKAIKKQYDIPESIIQQWLRQDNILPLLDGLDELGLVNQQKCIDAINAFVAERARYGLVVCCRREEYEASRVELNTLNGAVYLEPLRTEQIQAFFERLNRSRLWEHTRESPTLRELAQKPLFLSMLVVAYQDKPITNEVELFDAFIDQKLYRNGHTGVYPPNREPKPDQTRVYLMWLAQQLESIRETDFLIEGLQPSMLHRDRKELHFYKTIVRLSFGLISGLVAGLSFGLISGLFFGLIYGLVYGMGTVMQHLALRIVLTKNSYTPWNYARFLDHAVELRFMQRVGGRYRFVHDLLRKHFAAMSLDDG